MSRSASVTKSVSLAQRMTANRMPDGAEAVDVFYDKSERTWYAQFCYFTDSGSVQVGNLGFGATPVEATQHLLESNNV